jgi:hypothetical protein
MKHLLNNLSEEEKNSIREQHTDRIKIDTSRFKSLMESKLGDVKPLVEQESDNYINIQSDNSQPPKSQSNASNIIGKTVTLYDNPTVADEAAKSGKSIPQSDSRIGTIKRVSDVTGYGLRLHVDFLDIEKKSMGEEGSHVDYDRQCGCFIILSGHQKVYNTSLKNFLNKTYYQTDFASKQKPLGSIV